MSKADANIVRAYVKKYLNDGDIAEHLDAIQGDLDTKTMLYTCVSSGNTIELRKRQVELGNKDKILFNDWGHSLAVEKVLLFGIYLAVPKDGDFLINYLTADGRTRARLLRLEGEDEWLPEVEYIELLVSFLEGFFSGYRRVRPKTLGKPGIIMPGQDQPKGPGRIIIP